MSLKSERKKRVKAEKQATRAEFDKQWGVYDDGVDEILNLTDGSQLVKSRPIPMIIDTSKSYKDGNFTVVSNIFIDWAAKQPEAYIPGVAELFKHKNSEHRTGIVGGIGSPLHEHAKNAVRRVLSSMSLDQIKTAQAATQRLADKLTKAFPAARINEPAEPAATPEEQIDFWKKNESTSYQQVN